MPANKPDTKAILIGGTEYSLRELADKLNQSLDDYKESWHLRLINKTNKRFTHTDSEVKKVTQNDLDKISECLNKKYSIETFKKADAFICQNPYGIAFLDGNLVYNPNNKDNIVCVEGRTDYLTAIEIGMDNEFGIISLYNKQSKLKIESYKKYFFIMDKDNTIDNLKSRIECKTFDSCCPLGF
jgi:hypothetical protein